MHEKGLSGVLQSFLVGPQCLFTFVSRHSISIKAFRARDDGQGIVNTGPGAPMAIDFLVNESQQQIDEPWPVGAP